MLHQPTKTLSLIYPEFFVAVVLHFQHTYTPFTITFKTFKVSDGMTYFIFPKGGGTVFCSRVRRHDKVSVPRSEPAAFWVLDGLCRDTQCLFVFSYTPFPPVYLNTYKHTEDTHTHL